MWPLGLLFSSPELKTKVSFSDRLLSVVRLLAFHIFLLLHKNNWANSNQIWKKIILGEGE
jgi:hypothetical protein